MRRGLNESTRGKRRVSAPTSGLDVRHFPSAALATDTVVYRIHRDGYGPWWFSHDGSQRFDLPGPWGTCYVAEAPIGAFLETLTRFVNHPGFAGGCLDGQPGMAAGAGSGWWAR